MGNWLSSQQIEQFQDELSKEKFLAHQLSGDRFEDILRDILPDCKKTVVNTRDKYWFDLSQPNRGIEAKTLQISEERLEPGSSVRNVLKRVAPNLLPTSVTKGKGKDRQADPQSDPDEVGAAIIEYLMNSMKEHAQLKKIKGGYYFAILLRNKEFSQVAYWEELIDFGKADDYRWVWRERSLAGFKADEEYFTWYWAGGRQLFYLFEAPADVQIFSVPDRKWKIVPDDSRES